jgi:hypothetical protein
VQGLLIIIAIIFGIWAIGAIIDAVSERRRKKREDQLANEYGPKLIELEKRLDSVGIASVKRQLHSVQHQLESQLTVLEDENGKIINICPKCGDTLKIKMTNYYGKILGCPNYPKCRHMIKWSDCKPEMFYTLRTIRDKAK